MWKMNLPVTTVVKTDNAAAGEAIRSMRKAKKISLRRLAKALGITPPYLSDMELGRRGWSPERFALAQRKLERMKP